MTHKLIKTDNYLLVVDDSEIKVGDNCLCDIPAGDYFGVVAYNGAFAEHYYKKIIAHLPLNGLPILEGVDLLPPYSRYQEDGIEELAEINYPIGDWTEEQCLVRRLAFKTGYNKAREKYKYTEEDMRKAYQKGKFGGKIESYYEFDDFIQSIHQYPTEFETEDVLTPSQIFYPNDVPYSSPKTITTTQGVQWVGKYLK